MAYVLTDEKLYVGMEKPGKYKLVPLSSYACKYKSEKTAGNALAAASKSKRGWSKSVNDNWHIKEFSVALREKDDKCDFDIHSFLQQQLEAIREMEKRKEFLHLRLSECDRRIVDIQHCAEFNELNAAQGYKLYRQLHSVTVERRDIKNQLENLTILLKMCSESEFSKAVSNDAAPNAKHYNPRTCESLDELYA